MENKYISLRDLEVYKLARELSKVGWEIYEDLSWQDKKIVGGQFIRAVDSVGVNIAKGYGRFHYLDKIKFYYNSRGFFNECDSHWIELLKEREKIESKRYEEFKTVAEKLSFKLNNFICSTYKAKNLC